MLVAMYWILWSFNLFVSFLEIIGCNSAWSYGDVAFGSD